MKIICLHHAGGSSFLYSGWEQLLSGKRIVSLDLPGHGKKMAQKPFQQYNDAVDYLYGEICKECDEPYIIFGHSMGAEMLLHIIEKLERSEKQLPNFIILSGLSSKNDALPASRLSDDELLKKIYELGGIQSELLETQEFIEYFFPIIRTDFNMIENTPEYNLNKSKNKKYKVILFNGLYDTSAIDAEEEWLEFFDSECEIYHFEGDHFYLSNNKEEVCKIISSIFQ